MRMSRITAFAAGLAVALATATLTAPAATAAPAAPQHVQYGAPAFYLSLGDSLGFGYSDANLATFEQNHELSDFHGYTDDLAAYLGVAATNLSCPGETTASMIIGGCPWTAQNGPLHTPYQGPQLAAATAFLAHHRWQRGVITVSIGANDVLPVAEGCLTDPACPALQPALATMRGHLATILDTLRRADPVATVVVLAPYNPFGFAYPVSNIPAIEFDLNIAAVAVVRLDRVADAFLPINGRYPTTGGCGNLVYFCTSPANDDVHPTDAGYAVIARAFEQALR